MKKKILISLICCAAMQISTFAAPDIVPNAIPQAGAINNHDLETLRKQQIEKQVQEDYQNYQKRKKDGKIKPEKQKKIKGKVQKAKAEEYATKGVYVENIEVAPSQILTEEEIKNIIDEYTQTNLTFEQLQEIVDKINKLYLEKGFVTARAYLPEQTVENETVKIELLEGKVGDVTIEGNKWTRTKYINDRLNLEKGSLFNLQTLEQNLMIFNRYNDNVELNGTLLPGQSQIGTTDVDVKVRERLPFHVTALMDNAGRSTIGKYRGGLMLQDDSLFGFRDRLTLGAYANKYSVTPFADYNIPVNKKDGRIGFSFSSSNTKIGHGPYRIFNIKSRSQNYSLYYTQPLYRRPWTELTSTTSLAYKRAITSFDGYDLYKDEVTTAQTGLSFRYDTKRGIWYLNQNVSYSAPIFDKNSNYVKIDGGVLRLHDFGHGFVGTLRGNYQVIPNKRVVPYIDQMVAGGVATVRGYSEGLLIGRSGYILSAEMLFPILPRTIKSKDKTKEYPFLGSFMKGFVFADHAGIFPYKGTGEGKEGYDQNDFLMSLGFGFRFNLPKDINLRIAWGFPLMRNNHEEVNKCGRFHIELSITPDFDALVKLRKPKKKNIERVQVDDNTKVAESIESEHKVSAKRTVIKSLSTKQKTISHL
ncbi:ShlB/FhaC/HecB family hemolysin secretion/activation protein [bacterium]|nr:ShlB/FhaC/HecB family hemolysin secretion/activation protein [bacterium]